MRGTLTCSSRCTSTNTNSTRFRRASAVEVIHPHPNNFDTECVDFVWMYSSIATLTSLLKVFLQKHGSSAVECQTLN